MKRNLTRSPRKSSQRAKIAEAARAEMISKGIIDERGNLLKTELPEDMRKDADRDFGG